MNNILDKPVRPTRLKISLEKICRNVTLLKQIVGGKPILAVVKANGYGLGATAISKALSEGDLADYFGVATLYEGISLRNEGIEEEILILGPLGENEIDSALEFNLTPNIYGISFLESVENAAARSSKRIKVHIKVDSGMGRLGFRQDQIPRLIKKLAVSPHIRSEGIFSTLASADHPESDQTKRQIETFDLILDELSRGGIKPPLVHIANSAGLLFHPASRLSLVRPGLAMYGMLPNPELDNMGLEPVMQFETRILQIKDLPKGAEVGYSATYVTGSSERFALLPIGYADGLPRILSEKNGFALVNGKKAPFRGRISMDISLVSIDGIDAREGDKVILWGKDGSEEITPWDWAKIAGTIPYEITCGIGARVPRTYQLKNKEWSEVPFLG
jgi:alanine racemase